MCIDANILKSQKSEKILHRTLNCILFKYWVIGKNLRVAFLSIVFIKAEKHFWVRLRECIAWSRSEIESQIGLSLKFTADNFADLRRNEPRMIFELEMLTWRLWLAPPKYQNSFCKVAPHPFWVSVPSPYSKAKSSLILPKMKWISRRKHFKIYRWNLKWTACWKI